MKIDPRLAPATPVERAAARALAAINPRRAGYLDALNSAADRYGMDPARLDLIAADLRWAQLERSARALLGAAA